MCGEGDTSSVTTVNDDGRRSLDSGRRPTLFAMTHELNGDAQVAAGPSATKVEARTSAEAVVAAAAEEIIGSFASEEDIVTSSTRNLVAAPPSADEVEAAAPLNLVGTPARNNDVVPRGADDLIRPSRPNDRRLKAPAHRRSRSRARGRSEHHRCANRHCEHDENSASRAPFHEPLPSDPSS